MFSPLEDLYGKLDTTGESLVLQDPIILGEIDGVLYGSSRRDSFLTDGGVIYPTPQLLSHIVMGYDDKASLVDFCHMRNSGRDYSHFKQVFFYMPYRVFGKVLCAVAFVLPVVRVLFPSAVPRPFLRTSCRARFDHSVNVHSAERITALSFHGYMMILAIVLDEGGADKRSRVVIYDIVRNRHLCVLTHDFQKEVETLAWKPQSSEVLAVGCRGGVLLWTLNGCVRANVGSANSHGHNADWIAAQKKQPEGNAKAGMEPYALFYKFTQRITVTSIAFSSVDGRYLACGSYAHTHLKILDVSCAPNEANSLVCDIVPSIDGGVECVLFATDDSYIITSVCEAPILCLLDIKRSSFGTACISTPGPVSGIAKATGIGVNYYFLSLHGVEAILVAKINPVVGIEVVGVISTGVCRGVGGNVRAMTCSKRRLWIALETGHLLICHYTIHEGMVTLIPIGAAAMQVCHLESFDSFPAGSLLAIVERADSICFIPSYHI